MALVAVILCAMLFAAARFPGPYVVPDEISYAVRAREFGWLGAAPAVYEGQRYPVLYPLALAPSFFLARAGMEVVYRTQLGLNVALRLLLVGGVVLAWPRTRRRDAWYAAALVLVLPSLWQYGTLLASENLYIPLYVLTVLLLEHSLRHPKLHTGLLVGMALGALFATRSAAALAPIMCAVAAALWQWRATTLRWWCGMMCGLAVVVVANVLAAGRDTAGIFAYATTPYLQQLRELVLLPVFGMAAGRMVLHVLYLFVAGLGMFPLLAWQWRADARPAWRAVRLQLFVVPLVTR